MGCHGKAEVGGKRAGDLLPLLATIVRAVHPAVVLLVEVLTTIGRHHELVDALAELGVALGRELGPDAAIAGRPGRAPVARLERADRRDPDPDASRVGGVGDDGVEDETTGAGHPAGPAGVVGQALDVGPGCAVVRAPEQTRRFDAGEDRPIRCGRHVPHGLDGRTVVAVRQPFAGVGPGLAHVFAAPDGRTEPGASGTREQGAGARLHGDVVDRPAFAQGTAKSPVPAVRVTVEDEGPLGRTDEEGAAVAHVWLQRVLITVEIGAHRLRQPRRSSTVLMRPERASVCGIRRTRWLLPVPAPWCHRRHRRCRSRPP